MDVPGQRGANITMRAALSNDSLLLYKPLIGPYNTERLISFLYNLHNQLVAAGERGQRARNTTFVVVWHSTTLLQSLIGFLHFPECHFLAFILPLPKPHRRVFLHVEVEGL